MDDTENWNNFKIQELDLIDFSSEDDSLINFDGPLDPSFSGFLEADELSTMIGGSEKNNKHILLRIQEDIHRSTDSLSTLNSDTSTLKNIEGDVFEDVRASIQKCSQIPNVANSNNKKKLAESLTNCDFEDEGPCLSRKAAHKKANVGTLGSGKSKKQVPDLPQASKSVATQEESTRSPCKPQPSKVASRSSAISTISTKKTSLGANHLNLEKDDSKSTYVRGAPAPKLPYSGSSRNVVPRPAPPSRSSPLSAANRMHRTTSCSSLDSSGSGSSGSSNRISWNSMKQNYPQNCSSYGSTVKSLSTTASRGKSQSVSSHLTAYLRSATKHSSSISPSSSISEWSSESTSEWSSESTSSTAAAVHRPKTTRTSVDSSSSARGSCSNSKNERSDATDPQVAGLQVERVKGDSTGTALLCPASSKPSGLRMPSPNIGFFDRGQSAVCTPPGSISASADSKKAKLVGSPTAKTTSVQITQQTALTKKLRPAFSSQVPSNAAVKVGSITRNVRSPLISPKLHSRISPKTSRERLLKAGEAAFKVHDISTLENPHILQHTMSSESKGTTDIGDTKLNLMNSSLTSSGDENFICDAANIKSSQEMIKDTEFCLQFPQNEVYSLNNSPERTLIENQVNGLTRQVGAININVEKTAVSCSPESTLT